MSIPEFELNRIRRWAAHRLPVGIEDEIRIELDVEDESVTIFECRAPWRPDFGPEWSRNPVARLRRHDSGWSIDAPRATGAFFPYELPHAESWTLVDEALAEVDADPTGIFWG